MTRLIFSIVLLAAIVGLCGCTASNDLPTNDLVWYRDFYDIYCEQLASRYRSEAGKDNDNIVDLCDMEHYFQVRMGKMTVGDLKKLLGEPQIDTPDDCYYYQALCVIYGLETVEDPNWHGGNKHDLVFHYGETGPPHHIPDESVTLFFVAKDGIVIGLWILA